MKAVADETFPTEFVPAVATRIRAVHRLRRQPSTLIGGAILAVIVTLAILAPALGTVDPAQIDPAAAGLDVHGSR